MPPVPPKNAGPVREAHRFEEARLDAWMREHVDGYTGALQVRQFKGGQSNPTYWLADRERQYVLRKKPPGKLLQSAHAVDREYRVMRALAETDVPTATMYALCEDDAVIGTSFFVMEYVQGRIFWNVQLPELEAEERGAIYEELGRVLAAIHSVDLGARGLSDYGRPDAYVARQVKRWTKQYLASRTAEIEQMNTLIEWLPP
ncbi:MAG: phosphotransferase, partial [Deltaproteobacteria bacterium]|nr:phosphotransferase [Deltaproteobacteria bacterium]